MVRRPALVTERKYSAHTRSVSFSFFFFPPLDSGKLKLFDLEVHNKESYFIQSENYMTAVRKG